MGLQIRGYGRMVIGGEERPFQIGLYQSRAYCEEKGIELAQYQEEMRLLDLGAATFATEETVRLLVYSALKAGAEMEDAEVAFTAKKVSFWIDQLPTSELAKFFKVVLALNETGPEAGNAKGQQAKPKKGK